MFLQDYDPCTEEPKKELVVDGKKVTVTLLVTYGLEEYTAMTYQYLKAGDGFMILYSVSSREQFNQVTEWTNKILIAKDAYEAPIVIVGTNCDFENDARAVTTEEGKSMADGLNCPFFDVNATCSDEVNTVFTTLVGMVIREKNEKNKADKKKGKGSKDHDCVLM